VASTGLSVGGIIITRQLAKVVDEHGMPSITPWLGLLWAIVIVPTALLLVKPSPEQRGLLPDGDEPDHDPATPSAGTTDVRTAPAVTGASSAEARATRFFRLMTLSYVFVMLAQVGALAHQNKLASDRVSNSLGALAVSVTAGASVVGRLAGGVIVLRMPSRWLATALIGVQCGALTLMAHAYSREGILLASLLFGLCVGNLLMLQPLLIAEAYGVREYARIYGSSQLVTTVGVASGPVLLGFLQDHYDYEVAYMAAAAASVVALVLFVASGPVRAAATRPTPVLAPRPAVAAG
jgi:MFS family permease